MNLLTILLVTWIGGILPVIGITDDTLHPITRIFLGVIWPIFIPFLLIIFVINDITQEA